MAAKKKRAVPPRPIAAGDVVAAFSAELGEWTAAQIVRLDAGSENAAVLDLDWSGPEPMTVGELGDVSPLRLTHHSWNGRLSYCNFEWVLPRSYKVVGRMPLLHDEPSNMYGSGWRLGDRLARQRRWDAGVHEDPPTPWKPACTGGTHVEIRGARKPEWVTENRDDPLRDWDGQDHIGTTDFKKSVAQYKATRRAVMAVCSDGAADDRPARLTGIGREFGEAFNDFDRRSGFIATVEREDLFDALARIGKDAEAAFDLEPGWVFESLASGVESVRDW